MSTTTTTQRSHHHHTTTTTTTQPPPPRNHHHHATTTTTTTGQGHRAQKVRPCFLFLYFGDVGCRRKTGGFLPSPCVSDANDAGARYVRLLSRRQRRGAVLLVGGLSPFTTMTTRRGCPPPRPSVSFHNDDNDVGLSPSSVCLLLPRRRGGAVPLLVRPSLFTTTTTRGCPLRCLSVCLLLPRRRGGAVPLLVHLSLFMMTTTTRGCPPRRLSVSLYHDDEEGLSPSLSVLLFSQRRRQGVVPFVVCLSVCLLLPRRRGGAVPLLVRLSSFTTTTTTRGCPLVHLSSFTTTRTRACPPRPSFSFHDDNDNDNDEGTLICRLWSIFGAPSFTH
jgi:hypothetical protein